MKREDAAVDRFCSTYLADQTGNAMVGITKMKKWGKLQKVIRVRLVKKTDAKFPEEWEGFPVVVTVIGYNPLFGRMNLP